MTDENESKDTHTKKNKNTVALETDILPTSFM